MYISGIGHCEHDLKKLYAETSKNKMNGSRRYAKFVEEIQALALDREEKHLARLVKKAIRAIKDTKKEKVVGRLPNEAEIALAMEVVKQVLSVTHKGHQEGGAQ